MRRAVAGLIALVVVLGPAEAKGGDTPEARTASFLEIRAFNTRDVRGVRFGAQASSHHVDACVSGMRESRTRRTLTRITEYGYCRPSQGRYRFDPLRRVATLNVVLPTTTTRSDYEKTWRGTWRLVRVVERETVAQARLTWRAYGEGSPRVGFAGPNLCYAGPPILVFCLLPHAKYGERSAALVEGEIGFGGLARTVRLPARWRGSIEWAVAV